MRELVRQRGLGERVLLPGFRHDVAPFLAAADLLVQPSLSEGLPRTVLEAMAMGAPILASTAGGIPEAIRHDHNGFLVPPGNERALVEGIETLLASSSVRGRFSEAARVTVRERFTVERMVAEFGRWYRKIAGYS